MRRVIIRSLARVIQRDELWVGTGNRERWRHLLRASHPIRWAWRTWHRRRQETEQRIAQPDYAHLTVLRLRHPREAAQAVETIAGIAAHTPPPLVGGGWGEGAVEGGL